MTNEEHCQLTRIEKTLTQMHGRMCVIEKHVEESKPILEDYKATKNKSLGFITGVSSIAGIVGAAISLLLTKMGVRL